MGTNIETSAHDIRVALDRLAKIKTVRDKLAVKDSETVLDDLEEIFTLMSNIDAEVSAARRGVDNLIGLAHIRF